MNNSKPIVKGPVDGNAFAIIGAVSKSLREAGQADKITEMRKRCMEGDYNHLLNIACEYVTFDLNNDEDEIEFEFDDDD